MRKLNASPPAVTIVALLLISARLGTAIDGGTSNFQF